MEKSYLSSESSDTLNTICAVIEESKKIDPELYTRYNVKRGLRNSDGTGVLVGLTEVGDVHSYVMSEGEKIPVEGKLYYRGIEINNLVRGFTSENRFGFEECCYLLLTGNLPDRDSLKKFEALLAELRSLPAGFTEDMILKAPSRDIMNKLARSVLVSYSYDDNPDDISPANVLRQSIELIARLPAMAAYGYEAKVHFHDGRSLFIHSPKQSMSTAENFLRMIRPNKEFSSLEAEMLDLALVLHAEHGGGNNSTFVDHVVSSTGTDTYSAIAAAIGSLKGPQHGGANLKVMGMMEEIKANVKNWQNDDEVYGYLAKIIRKEAFDKSGLIYGIGHAVYTLSDPRAILLKEKAQSLAEEKGLTEELDLYFRIEKLAPEVFRIEKKNDKVMCANVDFYSGFVYKMLNIPTDLYTAVFAVGRIAGWCAHRIEELANGGRIIRPAYKNVMPIREYIPFNER